MYIENVLTVGDMGMYEEYSDASMDGYSSKEDMRTIKYYESKVSQIPG